MCLMSVSIKFVSYVMKIVHLFKKWEGRYTQTAQTCEPTFFLLRKESKLKIFSKIS